jgi:hypothetical protein
MDQNENADWELVATRVGEETVVEGTATQETSESLTVARSKDSA